jgi:uncharacterized protein YdhG (YjbR/CyaY superfamily)
MSSPPSPEIDAYIEAAPAVSRERLRILRALIREEAPGAVERIAYAMPTWRQGENLVHLAGYTQHVGLYPGPEAIVAFADALEGLPSSKGAIQLRHDRGLPLELVRQIVRWRVARAGEKAATKAAIKPARAR